MAELQKKADLAGKPSPAELKPQSVIGCEKRIEPENHDSDRSSFKHINTENFFPWPWTSRQQRRIESEGKLDVKEDLSGLMHDEGPVEYHASAEASYMITDEFLLR